ncbi:MAG: hypothetical protein D6828_04845, partial [Nitrospirae bacterium]
MIPQSLEEIDKIWRVTLLDVLDKIRIPHLFEEVSAEIMRRGMIEGIRADWHLLSLEKRAEKWRDFTDMMLNIAYSYRPYCLRCGECCRKGSPTLYREDASLLRDKIISMEDVYTLRKGEMAYDPIRERIHPLKSEMIKIKEEEGTKR